MLIATKTGDNGTTSLGGGRVWKGDDKIALLGAIDETSAAIGLIKAKMHIKIINTTALSDIQKDLITIMGQISEHLITSPELPQSRLDVLDNDVCAMQADPRLVQKDWILYGTNELSAACDWASKVCRRAEIAYVRCFVLDTNQPITIIAQYLNRLSDYLYLLARTYALG